jgi:predicted neutral ceramidase superfamily lipid hydrolase
MAMTKSMQDNCGVTEDHYHNPFIAHYYFIINIIILFVLIIIIITIIILSLVAAVVVVVVDAGQLRGHGISLLSLMISDNIAVITHD